MSEQTAIEWCDHTWSPWEGCTKVSPGCDHCYAAARNGRFSAGANWGPGAPRRRTVDWGKPLLWDHQARRASTRRRVFPSLCDPFDNEAPAQWRGELWTLVRETPHLDWLLLTKRVGNVAGMLPADWGDGYRNVWLGATVVNQEEADRDIPKLLAVPTAVRFVSIEPMLGPVVLPQPRCDRGSVPGPGGVGGVTCSGCRGTGCSRLDWVIAGGESGHGARPAHPDWFRSLRDQCAAAGVPFLFKQWGECSTHEVGKDYNIEPGMSMAHMQPKALRLWRDGWVAPAPEMLASEIFKPGAVLAQRVGKKAAGRLLDGVEHNGFPT